MNFETHYDLEMQPIRLIINAKCDYIQGCIIMLISKYKIEHDINILYEIIKYVKIALELCAEDKHYCNVGLGFSFCRINDFNSVETKIVISALQHEFSIINTFCSTLIMQK